MKPFVATVTFGQVEDFRNILVSYIAVMLYHNYQEKTGPQKRLNLTKNKKLIHVESHFQNQNQKKRLYS